MHLTGSLINSYLICPRKAWLWAHELSPDSENTYLEIGTLIGEQSYKREKKEITLPGMKIDLVRKSEGDKVIAEVKKSSKGEKAALMQLLFYLYKLEKKGIKLKGELLVPKEKKRLVVELTEEKKKELEGIFDKINLLVKGNIPAPVKIRFCRGCAYNEFCWAEVE